MLQTAWFKCTGFVWFITALAVFGSCEKGEEEKPEVFQLVRYDALAVSKTNSTQTWAHFMPWFVTPESSENGAWGIHWTMNTRNPENRDENGKREIASHFYPLTGPYASNDPDVLAYQLLLMKYSGIDGVLIDWYGSSDWNDYKINRINAEALIEALNETGLKFAIVYEDRTIPEVLKKDASIDRVEAGIADMNYLETNYFSRESYIHIDGRPLLLVFGPIEFRQASDWEELFAPLSPEPLLLVLNGKSNETRPVSSGEYIWVDQGSLDVKYGNKNQHDVFIGGAYPGFLDYYKEGGWGEGYFTIDHQLGKTFGETLLKAKNAGVDYLQLITWNDYGEGTMIEPTDEFGFTFLEAVQDFSGVPYSKTELERIFEWYQMKVKSPSEKQKYFEQVFYYLVSLQEEKAFYLLDSLNALH